MASDKACGLEITNEFTIMGTIDNMKSGKGKKLVLTLTIDDSDEIVNINDSRGCVCLFHVAVSKRNEASEEEEQDELDFDDIDPEV
mgnify:FL=1